MGEALQINKAITQLYIGRIRMIGIDSNLIEDQGVEAIAKALESNCTLTQLSLCKY